MFEQDLYPISLTSLWTFWVPARLELFLLPMLMNSITAAVLGAALEFTTIHTGAQLDRRGAISRNSSFLSCCLESSRVEFAGDYQLWSEFMLCIMAWNILIGIIEVFLWSWLPIFQRVSNQYLLTLGIHLIGHATILAHLMCVWNLSDLPWQIDVNVCWLSKATKFKMGRFGEVQIFLRSAVVLYSVLAAKGVWAQAAGSQAGTYTWTTSTFFLTIAIDIVTLDKDYTSTHWKIF